MYKSLRSFAIRYSIYIMYNSFSKSDGTDVQNRRKKETQRHRDTDRASVYIHTYIHALYVLSAYQLREKRKRKSKNGQRGTKTNKSTYTRIHI